MPDMEGAGDRYDAIGTTYSTTRREDPRIATDIHAALGPGGSLINIGAGTGNYEPDGWDVVAVEPSAEMLHQRGDHAAPSVRGVAEHLPFADRSFEVAMALLTIHHWTDVDVGLREMERVSRRQVVFFFEPLRTHDFWAIDYFPEALDLPTEQDTPGEAVLRTHLDVREIRPLLVPHDCQDGFGASFWARPDAYADPLVQAGMSWLAMLTDEQRAAGAERLRADLDSGAWDERYGHLRSQDTFDAGYRIAIAGEHT